MPSSLLIIGPSWVGDMVMAQSLLMVLATRHPTLTMDMLAPPWSLPLLARMPQIRQGVESPFKHGQLDLHGRLTLGSTLAASRYDWAILLPNSFKSAITPWKAGIPKRTGFVGEMRFGLLNDVRYLDKKRLPRTVDRFVALGLAPDEALPSPLPEPSLTTSQEGALAALHRLGVEPPQGPVLALCPGAEYGPAKRWPVGHFARVAQDMMTEGFAVWIFGSEKDAAVGEAIVQEAPGCLNLAGRTRLEEAIDLIAFSRLVVTNDSGLMHVAAAVARPLIAIYGSSDPGFTPPMSDKARVLRLGLECSPCFKRICPDEHTRCLTDITPQTVLAQLKEMA